ncbi:MAG: hypothetical protein MJE63_02565, partial [Proteobacteria bacterium]|nr:hypothetical protein [Pseudomonadota bacterium]
MGIDQVHTCIDEHSSDLALKAAEKAIEDSALDPEQIDVIADFSTLPEDKLVPVWSLTNRLQNELNAKNAFTIGFSGGGCSSLHTAIKLVSALISTDPKINSALLVAGERTVAGKRTLNPQDITTVCGDGASALMLTHSDSERQQILGSEIWTAGTMHDVLHIPAGAFADPLNYNNYRLILDTDKFEDFFLNNSTKIFKHLSDELLTPFNLSLDDISCVIFPNISKQDRQRYTRIFQLKEETFMDEKLKDCGHVQSSD